MEEGALVRVDQPSAVVPSRGITVEQAALMHFLIGSRKQNTEEEQAEIDSAKVELQEMGLVNDVPAMFAANAKAQMLENGGGTRELTYDSFGVTHTFTHRMSLDPGMQRPAECLRFPVPEASSRATRTYVLGKKGFSLSSELQRNKINLVLTPVSEFLGGKAKKEKIDMEGTSSLYATFSVLVSSETVPFKSSDESLGFGRPVLSKLANSSTKSRDQSGSDIDTDHLKSMKSFLESLGRKKRKKDDSREYSNDSEDGFHFLPLPDLLQLCSLISIPGNSPSSQDILSSTPSRHVEIMLEELQKLQKRPSDYEVREGAYKCCQSFPKKFAQLSCQGDIALGIILIPLGDIEKTSRRDVISHDQKQVKLEDLFPGLKNWNVYHLITSIYSKGKKCENRVDCYFQLSGKYPTSFKSPKFADDPHGYKRSNHENAGCLMLDPGFEFYGMELSENQVWNRIIENAQIIVRWVKYGMSTEQLQEFYVKAGTGLAAQISDASQKKLKPILEAKRFETSDRVKNVENPEWSVLPSDVQEYLEICENALNVERIQGLIELELLNSISSSNHLCINPDVLLSVTKTPKLVPGRSCVLELLRCLIYTPYLPCGFKFPLDKFMKSLLENFFFRYNEFAKKCVFYADVATIIAVFLHIVYHRTDCSIYCPVDIDVNSLGIDDMVSFVQNLCTKAYPWMKDCEFGNREEFIKSCFSLVNHALATLCHMNSIKPFDTKEVYQTLCEYVKELTEEKVQVHIASFRQKIHEYQQKIIKFKAALHLADFDGSHEKFMDKLERRGFLRYTFDVLEKGEAIPPEESSDEDDL